MCTKKIIFFFALCLISSIAFAQKGESDSKVQMGISNDRPAYTKIDLQKAAKENARAQALPNEEIFLVVEQMPAFPICDAESPKELKRCTQEALISYIVKHMKYPETLKQDKVSGLVVAQFVVSSTGSMRGIKILKTPAPEMAQEVTRVLNQLRVESEEKWKPGLQRGNPVSVQMNIPVRFKL